MNDTPSLSITDLAVIKNILDIAAKRGAFQASEMQTVGEVYNKLDAFLTSTISQAEKAQAESNTGESNA